jgi:transposase-like protein
MPLSAGLEHVPLAYPCPDCGQKHTNKGSWFRSIAHYRCLVCHHEVRMTYDAKLRLFADYKRANPKPR